jgi:hypothetical protein
MISSRCTILENIPTLGVEVKHSQTPGSLPTSPTGFDENAKDVLAERSYSTDKINQLKQMWYRS